MNQERFDALCNGDRVRYVGSIKAGQGKVYVVRDDDRRDNPWKIGMPVEYGLNPRRLVDCDDWEVVE